MKAVYEAPRQRGGAPQIGPAALTRKANGKATSRALVLGLRSALTALSLSLAAGLAAAQAIPMPLPDSGLVTEAREALRLKDKKRLNAAAQQAIASQHPLASWVDYWDLGLRLTELSQADLEAFYARHPGSYVEDRMRNDWLLELGRRRDWDNFARDLPRFKMNDDREVSCYATLTEHLKGRDVRERARSLWLAQRDGDDGCHLLASTLLDAKQFKPVDVWTKLRLSVEYNRPRAIKQAASLLGKANEIAINDLLDKPDRFLSRRPNIDNRHRGELATLALIRLATSDPQQSIEHMQRRWSKELPSDLAAWTWAQIGKQSAFRLQGEAAEHFEQALKLQGRHASKDWSDDTWAWLGRAALRLDASHHARRHQLLHAAGEALQGSDTREPVWAYWRARHLLDSAASGPGGEAQRQQARQQLQALAHPLHFYGQLALEDLGLPLSLPATPAPLSSQERGSAHVHGGLNRALAMISLGLRSEGVREWNFSLRGMSDRELLAAAQLACDREVWDRCIAASERSKAEIDVRQRYPLPLHAELMSKTREAGVDPAYVYGLIRQESRFVMDARSHVGASGLMQVMPNTAKWTAKKLGMAYRPEMLTERDFNLRIGTGYLKLVLDDFDGAMALAAAAYNAGPSRARRWRDGPVLDAAIWAENVPFNETRDYVKKVLANATVYAKLMNLPDQRLRERLGSTVGPRNSTGAMNVDLP